MRKADEFSLTKSQFHRVRKFITRAGVEVSQHPTKPLE